MALFTSTSPYTACDNTSGDGANNLIYKYGLRFTVFNPMYLRAGDGFGPFSNQTPDVLPVSAQMTSITAVADTGLLAAFDVEVYQNGVLVYTLSKPAGTNFGSANTGLPLFGQFDELCVRITNIVTQALDPRVSIVFAETT